MTVDVTWLGYFMAAVSLYYVVLFVLSMHVFRRRDRPDGPQPAMALIMPAHDEEAVIGASLESLVRLEYDRYVVIVVNDGSRTQPASARERSRRAVACSSSTDRPR